MTRLSGVFQAKKKSGVVYYRSSITYRGKHISLGSYPEAEAAHRAYLAACALLADAPRAFSADDYASCDGALPFEKWVVLTNFRDNGIYCHTPIYLSHRFFTYYLDAATPLKFDADDLFFYMEHKILRRGGHLFVCDYGMQLSLLSRYGIRGHAVPGRDFRFINGDPLDFRYSNIEVINRYHGVTRRLHHGRNIFTARIHINGDFVIGRYATEQEAAVAYNKAADCLKYKGFSKNYTRNYIEELSEREYAKLYAAIHISKKIRNLQFP